MNKQRLLIGLLSLLVVCLFVTSLFIGSNPLPIFQAARESLLDTPTVIGLIFGEIRLPRALIALFTGATLGL
ncbi:MAG: iron chelate uptake ABC transporter family permease subunit, partial [Sedimenticola sp.]|nr:iron chelate uptake ABC transporter family permease subunit [Sedimenticola sp.]